MDGPIRCMVISIASRVDNASTRASGGTELIAAQRTAATPSPRVPSFTPAAAVLAIVLIVGVALLGTQLALDAWPPVHVGATSAVLGDHADVNLSVQR